MSLDAGGGRRSASPASSGRSSPIPQVSRRAVEDELFKADKTFRRYGALIERAVASWEIAPQEWADYIAFLGRLLKAIQSHPKGIPTLPHTASVASKLAQCMNPALPSGVHQKAVQVYAYIFSAFSREYLVHHLNDYFPGLAPVLGFAALTVRPTVYALYEDYIVTLPVSCLRPAAKALILSLLPAIEDESSEDFDRALAVLEKVENAFASGETGAETQTNPFWQSLFLCVITSPSRRLGALNYLTRKLPRFADRAKHDIGATSTTLSPSAQSALSPEPGLLIQCLVAGLTDANVLVQRGFLDLLIANLPLHSSVLQTLVSADDLDRLVTAVTYILLRKDMSLNRRVWSFFLGPAAETQSSDPTPSSPPQQEPNKTVSTDPPTPQLEYFEAYGRFSVERCLLSMFTSASSNPTEKARPFRISVSLMDRWEIAESLVPAIFATALQSAYGYSQSASVTESREVVKSASLFFNSVESRLIWRNLVYMMNQGLSRHPVDQEPFQLTHWVLEVFDTKDEEMLVVYMPHALLLLTSQLAIANSASDTAFVAVAIHLAAKLVTLIPTSVFKQTGPPSLQAMRTFVDAANFPKPIAAVYAQATSETRTTTAPLSGEEIAQLLLSHSCDLVVNLLQTTSHSQLQDAANLLLAIYSKTATQSFDGSRELLQALQRQITAGVTEQGTLLTFPTLHTTATLLMSPVVAQIGDDFDVVELLPALVALLWHHLSPSRPKYHLEAVRLLWQLSEYAPAEEHLKGTLLELFQKDHAGLLCSMTAPYEAKIESVSRFIILWEHSIPAESVNATSGSVRRGSSMINVTDATQLRKRLDQLREPLFRLLDALQSPSHPHFNVVKDWLAHMASLGKVLTMCFDALQASLDQPFVPDSPSIDRAETERLRKLHYHLTILAPILEHGSDWTWECLASFNDEGAVQLTQTCLDLLSQRGPRYSELREDAVRLLGILLLKPVVGIVRDMNVDDLLLKQMIVCLRDKDDGMQGRLLQLTRTALQVGMNHDSLEGLSKGARRLSAGPSRLPADMTQHGLIGTNQALVRGKPSPALLQCLLIAFASESARPHLRDWVSFLADVLPVFADSIFAGLIPLVETLCRELQSTLLELTELIRVNGVSSQASPDATIAALLEALDLTLGHAHECLVLERVADEPQKVGNTATAFLSSVTSGALKGNGLPSKTAQANSRLTVILAFQDAIRVNLSIWMWCNGFNTDKSYDPGSGATATYYAQRVRSKTRYLLERIFSAELLESVEVVLHRWRNASQPAEAASALELLQVMQGSGPRRLLPAILDALCSRTNPSALPTDRQSSQTVDLSATDIAAFLTAYVGSTEDDAVDEVWPDCLAFVKDVLSNPLPHRQIMPYLLSLIHLLAQKVGNTNFGDQRKMRRDLADNFHRLLAATLTTLPPSTITEPPDSRHAHEETSLSGRDRQVTVVSALLVVIPDLDSIFDAPDRVNNTLASVCTGILSPAVHAKSFPANITSQILDLFLVVAKKAPSIKAWKKDVADAFNDHRLLAASMEQWNDGWLPILHEWTYRDRDRMPDLLSRLTAPSTAGIMFGVGANAARLEADRKTQLNLRRVCLLLLASPTDTWLALLRDFDEKLTELFSSTNTSSPSSTVQADLFMLCRALVMTLSHTNLSPLWPTINENLQAALGNIAGWHDNKASLNNLSLLQAAKLLDELVLLSPEEFQLHEWLYIADTTDAVYRPQGGMWTSLADQVADSLGTLGTDVPETNLSDPVTDQINDKPGQPLINSDSIDTADVKAMSKDEFAMVVLRPFLSRISMHAYEDTYAMSTPDIERCRQSLLADLLNLSTIVG